MDAKISNFQQAASLRRYTLTEGGANGLRVLDCDNGKIRFLLNESKALDIMQLYCEGKNISFVSKNGFKAEQGDFLQRFEGGMVYTCGLDSVGAREGFPLHGTLHGRAAKITRAECSNRGIFVEGEISDTALFGKNLLLKRRIYSDIGSDMVTLEDTLVNLGFREEDYSLLYHVNVGYPMLDEGAEIRAEIEEAIPRTPWAEERAAQRSIITAPVPEEEETCYFLRLKEPCVSLENKKIQKRFSLAYSGDTLPEFVQWKSMASGDYALGLEPCTTKLDDGFHYSKIAPNEEISFRLRLSVTPLD